MSTTSPASEERIGTLRGAGVGEVDTRRLGMVAAGVCVVALAASSIALFVAGAHKNAQLASLRRTGVPVTATVTGCRGLLGGSGSNPVGYACQATYTLRGHRYDEAIPGDALRAPGSTVALVVARTDPRLITTPAQLATEQPSGRVYLLPAALAGAVFAFVGALLIGRRRARRRERRATSQPALFSSTPDRRRRALGGV